MTLCRLSIPLKNHLSLPDRSYFIFEFENRLLGLEINSVNGLSVTSYSEKLDWIEGGKFKKAAIKAKRDGKTGEILRVYFRDTGISGGGTVQPNKFSMVNLYIEVEKTPIQEGLFDGPELKGFVERAINYFLYHYLQIGCDNDIPEIVMSDIPVVSIATAEKYAFTKQETLGTFVHRSHQFHWFDTERSGHLKEDFPMEWLSLLQGNLDASKPIPLHNMLLADAKRQSYQFSNHELAIVLSESAFEVFAAQKLVSHCNENRILKITFGPQRRRKTLLVNDIVEKNGISDVLSAINELSDADLKGGAEHRNWKEHAYEQRNDIVHRGASGFTREDAMEAFKAVVSYTIRISEALSRAQL